MCQLYKFFVTYYFINLVFLTRVILFGKIYIITDFFINLTLFHMLNTNNYINHHLFTLTLNN